MGAAAGADIPVLYCHHPQDTGQFLILLPHGKMLQFRMGQIGNRYGTVFPDMPVSQVFRLKGFFQGYFFIQVVSGTVKFVEKDGSVWVERENTDKLIFTAATASKPANILVGNTPGTALPHTGGYGTRIFTMIGSIMIAVSGWLMRKKKESSFR